MNIKIHKVNNKDIFNIKVLNTRHRGDLYYCDDSGFLKKMSLYQKIFYIFSKIFNTAYYNDIQVKLNILFSNLITRIYSGDKKELIHLFFRKLPTLSENIYDRSKINPNILNVLKKSLENVSDYQLLYAKTNSCQRHFLGFSYIPQTKKTKYKNTMELKRVILEALLATNLGIRFKIPTSCCSKTYFVKDINNNIIGVFKPAQENSLSLEAPFFLRRWRNKIFIKLGFGGVLFKHLANSCHIAEFASYKMDENMNINIVPPTTIIDLYPERWNRKKSHLQKGSFQIFVHDVVEAKKFLGLNKAYKPIKTFKKENIPELADELFDKLVINDVVCGNLDRHSENWLLELDEKKFTKAKNIVLIDGGLAFSPIHSSSYFERRNHYAWASTAFKWARKRFTSQSKEIIKDIYKRRFILRKKLVKLYIDQGDDIEIAKNRGDRMLERIEMLYYIAITKDMRKHEIINYRTQEEMEHLKTII